MEGPGTSGVVVSRFLTTAVQADTPCSHNTPQSRSSALCACQRRAGEALWRGGACKILRVEFRQPLPGRERDSRAGAS